ncbi:MAG: hypothetical protein WBN18_13375 [Flavobacteriaceae bacterium]
METTILSERRSSRITLMQLIQGIEGVVVILFCYLTFFLKPYRDRWGLGKEKAKRALPGDRLVRSPKSQFTHAIEIDAPSDCVWPWIAQMGQGRGGFYSYEALENLMGLQIHNAQSILPEFQEPKIGDLIPFGPKDAYPLVICDIGSAMAIENWYDLDAKSVFDPDMSSARNYLHLTWLWYVEPLDGKRSRFISRNRISYSTSFKNTLMFGSFSEPIVFAMDRKMCMGIKKRAEILFRNRD